LNHIALINRHAQRVVAHLDALAAASAALGKAAIAVCAGWDGRLVVGCLCGNFTLAGGFERNCLAFDAQAIIWLGLALLAAWPAARAGAVALGIALALLIALAGLALLTSLTILASLAILTLLAGLLAGCGLAGLLAGLGLRQLLDRPRQVVERLGGILLALAQSIGALLELIGQLRVVAFDLLGGILQRVRQIIARGLGKLAGLIGQLAQLLRRAG
jgi:hypothetical protein